MRSMIRTALAACALLLSATSVVAATPQLEGPPEPVDELRGIWLTNIDSKVLSSRASISKAMEFLERTNINVVFPSVWSNGYTLFPSEVAEKALGVKADPSLRGRDVLYEVIQEAHSYGIAVIPWFEYGFAASYKGKGSAPLEKNPNWAALGADGKPVEKNGYFWMNTLDPNVQKFMTELMVEVAAKYDVDGVQGDDRLPALPAMAGYDKRTIQKWMDSTGKTTTPDFKDPEWVKFRANLVTDYLRELRSTLRGVKPDLIFSSAPTPPGWGLDEFLQDSTTWLKEGLVDWIHPQAYHRDAAGYKATMTKILDEQYGRPASPRLFPSILLKSGEYMISEKELVDCIRWNREQGIQGEVLFFYEGLVQNKAMQKALLTGPYKRPAVLPRLPKLSPK